MSERHSASTEVEQQVVFDLMRARLIDMFGPGGSFRITMGRPAADDDFFVATVADTIAHEVATAFNPVRETEGRRVASTTPMAQHEKLWKHIERELGIRTTGLGIFAADVDHEVAIVHRTLLHHAA
ncbi:MAG: hypothetical protein H7226_05735 [Salinibacterium sp.]|nr:hypothetical protein [Salinibacterium sp.]